MTARPSQGGATLAAAVSLARANAAAMEALSALLTQVDVAVAEAGSACMGGGACCRFDLSGQRLYASTLELALLVQESPPQIALARALRCPYQVGPRCCARERRPLGCRVFFCRGDPDAGAALYEDFHGRIIALHANHGLPYIYAEATAAILQVYGSE